MDIFWNHIKWPCFSQEVRDVNTDMISCSMSCNQFGCTCVSKMAKECKTVKAFELLKDNYLKSFPLVSLVKKILRNDKCYYILS